MMTLRYIYCIRCIKHQLGLQCRFLVENWVLFLVLYQDAETCFIQCADKGWSSFWGLAQNGTSLSKNRFVVCVSETVMFIRHVCEKYHRAHRSAKKRLKAMQQACQAHRWRCSSIKHNSITPHAWVMAHETEASECTKYQCTQSSQQHKQC